MAGWSSNIDIRVSNVKFWVYIAEYGLIGLDNSLEVDIDEEVVRVDMLFDETFHLQERWKEVPFILHEVRVVIMAVSVSQIKENTPFEDVKSNSTQHQHDGSFFFFSFFLFDSFIYHKVTPSTS